MPSRLRRFWNVFRRSRLDDELRQEMEIHLAFIEEDERRDSAQDEGCRPLLPDGVPATA
jgi:hypothetical protein